MSAAAKSEGVVLGLEDRPGTAQSMALGLQHVLVSNVWLDPVFVAAVAGLSATLAANLVNAIFLAAGLVTIVQSTRLVKLPVVEGPSAAFDGLMIGFGKAGQLAAATTGLLIGGAIVLLFSVTGLLGRVRRLFSPAVTGAVILLVGIALASFTLVEYFGGNPKSPSYATAPPLIVATITMLVVLVLTGFGRGIARTYAFLWALIAGDLVSAAFGMLHFDAVGSAAWLGIPRFLPYGGLKFDAGVTGALVLAYLVATIEAIGVYYAAGEIAGTPITNQRINLGMAGEAAGSMISSLFGGFATTAYAQNVGLLRLTGVASRFPVTVAGVIFLVLAFIPKMGAFLVATPDPVVGGIFLPAAASLIFTGVAAMARTPDSPRHIAVGGLAVMLGTGIPALGDPLISKLPPGLGQLASQPVVVGAIAALALELLFVQAPRLFGAKEEAP
ncbi:MAG TPA: solute carrier family 23 protein [Chloroflexota bacterium]